MAAVLDPRLKARFLLGNHDFDLYQWADYIGWERRYFLPDTTLQAPSTIVLHGDVFDWVENLSDPLQQIMVYLFAPHLSASSHDLGAMQRLIRKSHGKKSYKDSIQARQPVDLGASKQLIPGEVVPARWNVHLDTRKKDPCLKFLSSGRKKAVEANRKYEMNLRVMFIGHTHYARIAVHETDGNDFFALVDCGAWIERCAWVEDGQAKSAPSAQLGALSGNDVRIYQLG
jgi:UDP-2,3-diacylglucosamine pyrophosphatase LpxH